MLAMKVTLVPGGTADKVAVMGSLAGGATKVIVVDAGENARKVSLTAAGENAQKVYLVNDPGLLLGGFRAYPTSDTAAAATIVIANTGSGDLYWVATESAVAPSSAQIQAGEDENGDPAVADGSQAAVSGGATIASVTGLTAETTYWLHAVFVEGLSDSNVVTSNAFTTPAA